MPRITFRLTVSLATIATAACAREAGPGPGAWARDSAGITIVRSSEPRWRPDSAWRVSDTPRVSIGGDGLSLGRVAAVVRTPSGAIAAADGDARIIRVFEPDGRPLRSLGRKGTGQGEFQALEWIAPAGDSILAFDLVARRYTMFGAARIRTASLRSDAAVVIDPAGRFADGTLLVASGGPTFPFGGRRGEVQIDSALLLHYDADGHLLDTIARARWSESFGVSIGEAGGQFLAPMPRPFGPRTSAAVAGEDVAVSEGRRYEVRLYARDGSLKRILRRARTPLPVTPEAIAAYREAHQRGRVGSGPQGEVDAAMARALDSAPWPKSLPAYDRLMVDGTGNIWAREYALRRGQSESWNIFDEGGSWLGSVQTPAGFRAEQVGATWILGVWQDAEGSEQLRMYPIVKP